MREDPTPLALVTGLFQQPIENKERITTIAEKSKVNNLENEKSKVNNLEK